MAKIEGYGSDDSRGWLWPVVLLVVAVMFCGTIVFGGVVALKLMRPAAPAVNPYPSPYGPTPVYQLDPAAPLAPDPQWAPLTQQAAMVLTGQPIAADTRDTLWGLAVTINDAKQTVTTPQLVQGIVGKAGAVAFGTRKPIPPTVSAPLDQMLLAAMGPEPDKLDDARRARIVAALRAMALGADQAAGG